MAATGTTQNRLGDPRLFELVRVAQAVAQTPAEIVTLVSDHAVVVASLGRNVLQPRPLVASERRLVDSLELHASTDSHTSLAIRNREQQLVGILTVAAVAASLDGLDSVARLAAEILGDDTAPTDVQDGPAAILEALRDPVVVVDSSFTITYASRNIAALVGRTPQELQGRNAGDYIHDDDMAQVIEAFHRLATGREVYRVDLRFRHGNGSYVRVEVTGSNSLNDPLIGGVVLSLRSGDRDLELLDDLEREKSVLGAVLDQLHEGVIATDTHGVPTVVNQAAKTLHGIARTATASTLTLHDLALFDAALQPVGLDQHPITRVRGGEHLAAQPYSLKMSDGSLRHVVVSGRPVVNANGDQVASALAYHDMTDARLAESDLRDRALHDPLTGLANRQQLHERLAWLASAPNDVLLGLCFIDLDGFKLVNDTFGHAVGDEVLRTAARRLSAELRPSDLLARFGGDEFVALLTGAPDTFTASAIAERLRRTIARPFVVDGTIVTLSASMGLAISPSSELNEESLLRAADVALYTAKAAGKNRVELFDDQLATAAAGQHRQLEFLRDCLQTGRVVVHYQPAVDVTTGNILGIEALTRCLRPDGTVVTPSAFDEAALASGLIVDLDRQALALTCQGVKAIQHRFPDVAVSIACNFANLTVSQPAFAEETLATLAAYDVHPDKVLIQISESTAFDMSLAAGDSLRALASCGIRLVLDDFGTGHGSLLHLRDLPLIAVKLQRTFLAGLGRNTTEVGVAEAIVRLAQTLTPVVVAEGIETREHLEEARSIGFKVAQGDFYSPPVPLEKLLDLLADPLVPGSHR